MYGFMSNISKCIFGKLTEENIANFNVFSIKPCRSGEEAQIVGHLPIEISRITHFILQRGATVSASICFKHYR